MDDYGTNPLSTAHFLIFTTLQVLLTQDKAPRSSVSLWYFQQLSHKDKPNESEDL
jgi:hypothetical protein